MILAAFAALLAFQAQHLSLTVDEPGHLLSAHLYWNGRDRLPPGDMPPLIKIVGGWAIRDLPLAIPKDLGRPGDDRYEWTEAVGMVSRTDHATLTKLVWRGRLPLIVFPLLTGILLWRWGRALFHPFAGVAMLALWALEPTALGHGALFKNDHAAAFTYLLFWFCVWREWRSGWLRFSAIAGLTAGLAALAKLSLLILIPVSLVVIAVRWIQTPPRSPVRLAGSMLVALAVAYLLIIAAYRFETHRIRDYEIRALEETAAPRVITSAGHLFRLVPAANSMWTGVVSLFQDASHRKQVYLMGELVEDGSRLFFAIATAVKASLGVLLLLLIGLGLLMISMRAGSWRVAAWIVGPLILYAGLASLSNLQLGIRLILPALPFTILVCGFAIQSLNGTWLRGIVPACLALLAYESLSVYPNGIGFFNLLTGGPEHGLRYLSGSNVGWGQELPDLARTIDRLGWKQVRTFYFGGDTLYRVLRHDQFEFMAPPWGPELARGPVFRPEPGYYAVSAALLTGHLFDPRFRDYFDVFRKMRPVAVAGASMYLYKVP